MSGKNLEMFRNVSGNFPEKNTFVSEMFPDLFPGKISELFKSVWEIVCESVYDSGFFAVKCCALVTFD